MRARQNSRQSCLRCSPPRFDGDPLATDRFYRNGERALDAVDMVTEDEARAILVQNIAQK